MKAEFPAGAFTNRAAIPAPNPSSHPKNKNKKWTRRARHPQQSLPKE
jgi:hypothetical protein